VSGAGGAGPDPGNHDFLRYGRAANTPMVVNEAVAELFASAPASSGADVGNLLDVQLIEAVDVSNAIAWLVSDEARYVTAVALPVDAGFTAK
ncbi:MAG TPA: hypothetical protein VJ347_03060, partial [Streptosporangiaceae bacterium]|nr:hypothetical protein [Streptosporangiaceae bacterium]